MKDINAAYDQIQKDRKAGRTSYGSYNGGTYGGNGGYYNAGGYNQSYGGNYSGSYNYGSSQFSDIRRLISQNRIAEAEELLDGVPEYKRSAEWYFLKGSVYYRRGWLNEASRCFQRAYQMEPNNQEYAAAWQRMAYQQQYGSSPGRNTHTGFYGCDCCDCCATLMCMDCIGDCLCGNGCC